MADSIQIAMELVSQVRTFPQSLVVLAGNRGSGKTRLAKMLAAKGFGTYINLSLTLSRYVMTGSSADGTWWANHFIVRLLPSMGSEQPLILDNIEAMFQPELQLNALSWFLQTAREVPLVVVWPRTVLQGEFVYSTPNRPDYYHQRDLSVVVLNVTRNQYI